MRKLSMAPAPIKLAAKLGTCDAFECFVVHVHRPITHTYSQSYMFIVFNAGYQRENREVSDDISERASYITLTR